MALEELPKSYHGYCLCNDGVWRFEIPISDNTVDVTELKIEPVFTCDPHLLSTNMGFFNSGNKVYMVGGTRYHPIFKYTYELPDYKLHVLDPTSFKEVKNPQFLKEFTSLPTTEMRPLLSPMVIESNHQIYFLTHYTNPWLGNPVSNICFQSFDSIENRVQILQSPPYTPKSFPNLKGYCNYGLATYSVISLFAVCGYIYLIIREKYTQKKDTKWNELAFCFDTKSSIWNETKSMLDEFRDRKIPIPFHHRGHTGVSEEFVPNNRILVALSNSTPTAYRVTLGSDGSLTPQSSRHLKETNFDDHSEFCRKDGIAQLLDIGGGKFCVIHQSEDILPLKVYAFQIDFKAEHAFQASREYSSSSSEGHSSARASSVILCSRKLLRDIPSIPDPSFYAYCLASAPASQSSDNQIAAAEVHDMDGNLGKRKRDNEEEDGNLGKKKRGSEQEQKSEFQDEGQYK